MPDPALIQYTVTCHTEGCDNEDVPITLKAAKTDPFIQCGPCGVQITDL